MVSGYLSLKKKKIYSNDELIQELKITYHNKTISGVYLGLMENQKVEISSIQMPVHNNKEPIDSHEPNL